jgi:Ca-activated chloride channel family protein
MRQIRHTECGNKSLSGDTNGNRRGAMLVLILVCLPVILAFSVFAINIAWMQLTRTQLRTATDAAARAGGRTLSITQDTDQARAAAITGAGNNSVAGQPLLLAATDLQFGTSNPSASGIWMFSELDAADSMVNAVRVTGRRTAGAPSGPVPLLFAGLFDRTTFEPIKSATASQTDRDVVLVLDRSGSMGTWTPTGTRWTDLVDAVDVFLDTLELTPQDEQVALATYSTNAAINVDLTYDYQQIRDTVAGINPNGLTAIGKGIQMGQTAVTDASYARNYAKKTIVVMTDGNHNRGIDPVNASTNAYTQNNITVHTITFSSGANENHMIDVANAGKGQHWHADDQASLLQVFEDVANNLPTLITE